MNNPSNPNKPQNPNQNQNSGSGSNRSRSHHRSRKFNRGDRGPGGAPAPAPRPNQSHQPHQQRSNRPTVNHHNRSHHQQPQGGGIDQVLMQYDRLMEQHIEARRKYHELYYRCDDNRLNKLEDQFFITAQRLIRFERELRPWQVEQLRKQRTEIYPLDTTYSSLYPEAEKIEPAAVQSQPVVVQHISPVQKARPSYRDDREVSEGTVEDYLQYKATFS